MIPQLPSRNDFLKKSQFVWLQEKAAYDRSRTGSFQSNLWYVDGAYYDLTNFINTHPGGSDFLKMTKGQDITELFYTHHLDLAKCQVILKKYFCSKADKKSQIFTFQEDGFYRTIQRKVETHFKHNDSGHSPLMHFITYLSIITFTFLLLLTGFFNSTVLAILTGFNLHILVGLGHSYLHQGSNQPFRYVFDFLLNSHYGWYVSHCISHHPFPNTLIDLEMSSLEPFMTYIRSRPKHSKFVWFYWHIFAGLIGLFEYILLLSGIVLNQEIFRPEYLIPILEYLILASVTSWGDGLILLLTMQFVASYLMIIVSFIVHRTTFQYSDGCQAQAEKDFGLYILQTTTDYDTQIKFPWNLILFESFNDHILHHLFPTVSISRIGELHPYLDETLKEFNLIKKYKNFGFFELSLAHIELINGQQYTPLK